MNESQTNVTLTKILNYLLIELSSFSFREYVYTRRRGSHANWEWLRHSISGRRVYCVGTGPSLDLVDLGQIKDAVVILLNGAIHRRSEFSNSSNLYIWLAQDVAAIEKHIHSVPDSIRKVVSIDKYSNLKALRASLRAEDILLFPGISIRRRVNDRKGLRRGLPYLRPVCVRTDDIEHGVDLERNFGIFPKTVMLLALGIASYCMAREIVTLGFDCSDVGEDKYAKGVDDFGSKSTGFGLAVIERYLDAFNRACTPRGIVIENYSPLTKVQTLRKRTSIPD